MNAVPIGHEDGEVSHVKPHQVLVENKESYMRKAFLVVMLGFVVVYCIRLGTSVDKPASSSSSSNLFGERSLKGLFGLCGKKDDPTPPPPPPPPQDFTQLTFDTELSGQTVAVGETKMYKATVPQDRVAGALANFPTGGSGSVQIYANFEKTKPADSADTGSACHDASTSPGGMGDLYIVVCKMNPQSMDTTLYVWVVGTGTAATTFSVAVVPIEN